MQSPGSRYLKSTGSMAPATPLSMWEIAPELIALLGMNLLRSHQSRQCAPNNISRERSIGTTNHLPQGGGVLRRINMFMKINYPGRQIQLVRNADDGDELALSALPYSPKVVQTFTSEVPFRIALSDNPYSAHAHSGYHEADEPFCFEIESTTSRLVPSNQPNGCAPPGVREICFDKVTSSSWIDTFLRFDSQVPITRIIGHSKFLEWLSVAPGSYRPAPTDFWIRYQSGSSRISTMQAQSLSTSLNVSFALEKRTLLSVTIDLRNIYADWTHAQAVRAVCSFDSRMGSRGDVFSADARFDKARNCASLCPIQKTSPLRLLRTSATSDNTVSTSAADISDLEYQKLVAFAGGPPQIGPRDQVKFRTCANGKQGTITRSVLVDSKRALNRIPWNEVQGNDGAGYSMFGRHYCHRKKRTRRLQIYFNNRLRAKTILFSQVDSCCKHNTFDPLIPFPGFRSTAVIQIPEPQNQSNEHGAGRLSRDRVKNSANLASSPSDHRKSSLARRILANVKRADCVASTNSPEDVTISHQQFPVDPVPQGVLHYPGGISTSRNISVSPRRRENLASADVNGCREETKSTEPALTGNTLGVDTSIAVADRIAVLVNRIKQRSLLACQDNRLDYRGEYAKRDGILHSYLAPSVNEYQGSARERNYTRQSLPREWAPFTHRYSNLRKSLRTQSMTNYWVEHGFKQDVKRHTSVQTASPWYDVAASSAAIMNWDVELTLSGTLTDVPQNGQIRIHGTIKPKYTKNEVPAATHNGCKSFEDSERLGDAEIPHPLQSQCGVVHVATQLTDHDDLDNINTEGKIINNIAQTAPPEAFAHFSGTVVPTLGSKWEQLDENAPCSEVKSMSPLARQCLSPTSVPPSNSSYGRTFGTHANAFVEQEHSPVEITNSPQLLEGVASDSRSGGHDIHLMQSTSTSDHNVCLVHDEQNALYPFSNTVADTLTDVNRASLETLPVPLRCRNTCRASGKSSSTSHRSDFARGSITRQTSNTTSASSTPYSYVDESDCPDSLNITDSEISRINERLHHLCEHPGKPSMMARLLLNRANSSGSSRTPNSASTGEFGGLQARTSACLFPKVCNCSDISYVMHAVSAVESNMHCHRSSINEFQFPEIPVLQKGSLRSKGEVFASHHTDDGGECLSKQPSARESVVVTGEMRVANTSTVHEWCNPPNNRMQLKSNFPEDKPLGESLGRHKSLEESIRSSLVSTVSVNDRYPLTNYPEKDSTGANPVVGSTDKARVPEMCFIEGNKLQQWTQTNKGYGESQVASSLSEDGDETVVSGGGLSHNCSLVPNDPVVGPVMEHTMTGDDTTMEHTSGLPILHTHDGQPETNAVSCDEIIGYQVKPMHNEQRDNAKETLDAPSRGLVNSVLDHITGSAYSQDSESSSAASQVPSIIRLTEGTEIGVIMSEVRLPVMSFPKPRRTVPEKAAFNSGSREALSSSIFSNLMRSSSFVEEPKIQKADINSSDCHQLEHLRCTDETEYPLIEANPHGSIAASSPPQCVCMLYTVEQAPAFEDSSFGVEENFHNEEHMVEPFARIETVEMYDKALKNEEDESCFPMELGKWFCGAKVYSKVKRYETYSLSLVPSHQAVIQSGSQCVAKDDGLDENTEEELRGSCDTMTTHSGSKVRTSVHSAHRSVLSVVETAVDVRVVLAAKLGFYSTQPLPMTRVSEIVTIATKKFSCVVEASGVLQRHGHECVPNCRENCERKLTSPDLMNGKWLSFRYDYVTNTRIQPHCSDPPLSDVKNSMEKQAFPAHDDTCLCGSSGQPFVSKVVMCKSQVPHVYPHCDMHFYPSNESRNQGCSKTCTAGLHYVTDCCSEMKLIHNKNRKPEARTVHLGQTEHQKSGRYVARTSASSIVPSSKMESKTLFTVLCSIPKFFYTRQSTCNPADVSETQDNCLERASIYMSGLLDCYEPYHVNEIANCTKHGGPLCFVLAQYLASSEMDAVVPTCSLVTNSTLAPRPSVIRNTGEVAHDSNQVIVSIRYQLRNDLIEYAKIDYSVTDRMNRSLMSPTRDNVPRLLRSKNRKSGATKNSDRPTYNSDYVSQDTGHRLSMSAKSVVVSSNTAGSLNSDQSGRNGSHFVSLSPQLLSSSWSSNTLLDRQSGATNESSIGVLNLSDSYLNVDPKFYNRIEPLPHPKIRSESSGMSPSITSNTSQQSLYSDSWCMPDVYISKQLLHNAVNGLGMTGGSDGTADPDLSFSSTRGRSECGNIRVHSQGDPKNCRSSGEWLRADSPRRSCEMKGESVSRTTISGRHSRNSRAQLSCLDSDLNGRSASLPVLPSPVGIIDYLKHFRTACSLRKQPVKASKHQDVPATSSSKQSTETISVRSIVTTHSDRSGTSNRTIPYQTQGDFVSSFMRSTYPYYSQWCLSVDSIKHRITGVGAENEIAHWKGYKEVHENTSGQKIEHPATCSGSSLKQPQHDLLRLCHISSPGCPFCNSISDSGSRRQVHPSKLISRYRPGKSDYVHQEANKGKRTRKPDPQKGHKLRGLTFRSIPREYLSPMANRICPCKLGTSTTLRQSTRQNWLNHTDTSVIPCRRGSSACELKPNELISLDYPALKHIESFLLPTRDCYSENSPANHTFRSGMK